MPRVLVGHKSMETYIVSAAFWPDEVTVMNNNALHRVGFEYNDPLLFDRVTAELEVACTEWHDT